MHYQAGVKPKLACQPRKIDSIRIESLLLLNKLTKLAFCFSSKLEEARRHV